MTVHTNTLTLTQNPKPQTIRTVYLEFLLWGGGGGWGGEFLASGIGFGARGAPNLAIRTEDLSSSHVFRV